MERLTDKSLTKACNDPWDYCGLDHVCKRDCHKPEPCRIPKMVHRLAEIEDILGDTYDLGRLRELVQADRDGRCVVLPCKVGETLYRVKRFKRRKSCAKEVAFVTAITLNENNIYRIVFGGELEKTVFQTHEAAEKALKEVESHAN